MDTPTWGFFPRLVLSLEFRFFVLELYLTVGFVVVLFASWSECGFSFGAIGFIHIFFFTPLLIFLALLFLCRAGYLGFRGFFSPFFRVRRLWAEPPSSLAEGGGFELRLLLSVWLFVCDAF